jgi:protein phosphatase
MSCYPFEPDPFPSPRRLRISAACRTDVGSERPNNEDRVVFAQASTGASWEPPASTELEVEPCAFFALVCDGMGGEAGGEIASSLAASAIVASMRAFWSGFAAHPAGSTHVAEQRLARAMVASIEGASARLRLYAREHPRHARMGTTATLAALAHDALVVAQVGDSRAYHFRKGRLVQLTRDQTMAELIRSQMQVPVDADAEIVGSHVILQALGSSARLDVVVSRHPVDDGDVVLVCSDGLSGPLRDAEIAEVLGAHADVAAACDALVARANAAGGPDNVSCVAFRVSRRA